MQEFLQKLNTIQRLHNITADYEKTLALLAALKSGTISLDSIQLTADGWQTVEVTIAAPEVPEPEATEAAA